MAYLKVLLVNSGLFAKNDIVITDEGFMYRSPIALQRGISCSYSLARLLPR